MRQMDRARRKFGRRARRLGMTEFQLAVCEMLYLEDAPVPVIIDEAIELAKKYSTENSGKFVNGVLDSIAKLRPTAK